MMIRVSKLVNGLKPILLMVIVQVAYAGINILYKITSNQGMNLRILIAYRYVFAAAFTFPLAFILERKSTPKLTWKVIGQAFLCALFGGTLCQNFYLESLALTSATFASAMANLAPGVTFILAVSFRLEKVGLRSEAGKAKVGGTLIGITGAMILTFYKGVDIIKGSSKYEQHNANQGHATDQHEAHARFLGSFMALAGCVSYAAWLIVQAKMSEKYPSQYWSTALMSLFAAVQSVLFALCMERDLKQWKLGWDVRLLTVAYSGIVVSGLMVILMSWCVRKRGPLFVSIFNPLLLVLVALAGSVMLDEKLYLGSVLGAILIVLGLYGVLWGKAKELKKKNNSTPMNKKDPNQVLEIQTSKVAEEITSKENNHNSFYGVTSTEEEDACKDDIAV